MHQKACNERSQPEPAKSMDIWTEIKITVPVTFASTANAIANMCVPYGIYTEDYSDLEQGARDIAHIDLIDEELLQKDRDHAIIHIYISPKENPAEAISFLTERLTSENIPFSLDQGSCNQEDWINNWKQYFKPIPVGNKLLIHPVWEAKAESCDRIVMELEPGIAFGSGTHETTKLCLCALEDYIFPGCTMLDVGCGSGILSIASLLLGASHATGVDIDPLAVKTASQNGMLNKIADNRLTLLHGDLTNKVSGTFDVIAANIVADAILSLSANIRQFMKKDSVYLVSGIIDTRADEVQAALKNFGLKKIRREEDNGWVLMAFMQK